MEIENGKGGLMGEEQGDREEKGGGRRGPGLFIIWKFDRKRREEEEGRGTEGQPRSCPSGGALLHKLIDDYYSMYC